MGLIKAMVPLSDQTKKETSWEAVFFHSWWPWWNSRIRDCMWKVGDIFLSLKVFLLFVFVDFVFPCRKKNQFNENNRMLPCENRIYLKINIKGSSREKLILWEIDTILHSVVNILHSVVNINQCFIIKFYFSE